MEKDRILKSFEWSFSETETSLSLSCESVSLNKTIKNIMQWRSSRLGGPVLHAVPFSLLFPVKSLSGIFIWIDYYHNSHAQNAIKVSCLLPRLLLCCRSCPSLATRSLLYATSFLWTIFHPSIRYPLNPYLSESLISTGPPLSLSTVTLSACRGL